ncbi:hypothetical protein FACS189487_05370 [Campylobacterota bacterium]|nr:hypothetical protein FACS189487_05370 [Campylobacterota bacterium]
MSKKPYPSYSIYDTVEGRKWVENPNKIKTFDYSDMFDLLESICEESFKAGQNWERENPSQNVIDSQSSEIYPVYA